MPDPVSRRTLLGQSAAIGAGAATGCAFLFRSPRPIAGSFVDRSHEIGHRIRDGQVLPVRTARERVAIAIVGGGIAGLSAAWRLKRLGFADFALLELERAAGGNSRSGRNEVTPYPWGAHYVPIPDRRIPLVEELFEELGVLRQGRWDGRHVSREPLNRLFMAGEWTPGIEPDAGAPGVERDQFDRFWERMEYFRRGGDFTIPMRPPRQTAALDRISMKSWMIEQGFFAARLRWYVDYACRDDYGCSYGQASAWAGIHYFAARPENEAGFLTWPEGNGWIVRRLAKSLGRWLRLDSPALRIRQAGRLLEVVTPRVTFECEAVIFAAPTFLAPYLLPEWAAELPSLRDFSYAPWYTANLVVDRPPRESGAPVAWENILYDSPGLGYVVATHQNLARDPAPTVWTYYRALAGTSPRSARQRLLQANWQDRKEEVLRDLERAHPDLRECVARLDVMRLGHAMIRPSLGMMTSEARLRLAAWDGPIQFANADLSGISIFEEAQYRGVRAADRALGRLGYRDLEYADEA